MAKYYGVQYKQYEDGKISKLFIEEEAEERPEDEEYTNDNDGEPGGYDFYLKWFDNKEEASDFYMSIEV